MKLTRFAWQWVGPPAAVWFVVASMINLFYRTGTRDVLSEIVTGVPSCKFSALSGVYVCGTTALERALYIVINTSVVYVDELLIGVGLYDYVKPFGRRPGFVDLPMSPHAVSHGDLTSFVVAALVTFVAIAYLVHVAIRIFRARRSRQSLQEVQG